MLKTIFRILLWLFFYWICAGLTASITEYILLQYLLALAIPSYFILLYEYCLDNPKKYSENVDKEILTPIYNIFTIILLFLSPWIAKIITILV